MKELREFTKTDWYGWAGAERFIDGSEPQIAEWDEGDVGIIVIADRNGIEIILSDDEDNYDFMTKGNDDIPKKFVLLMAKTIIEELESRDTELKGFITYLRENYPEMQEDHNLF